MDFILGASILAAFIAGMVALFAPCCITVLLPAYLASAFREKKNIIRMTLVFFAGISVVLIPIGLGAAGLAQFFRDFHKEMYIFGGLLMIFLAWMSVSGKGVTMVPIPQRWMSKLDVSHTKSVFVLGIFSGAATSCCAPVLAGAVTLAVLTGTFWKALIVTIAYVFGMVFPLFIAAYFYDKFDLENSKIIKGKMLTFKLGQSSISIHSTNLLAGFVFLGMGLILLVLGFSGNAFWSPTYQAAIGMALNKWSASLFEILSVIPDVVWGFVFAVLFIFLLYKAKKNS